MHSLDFNTGFSEKSCIASISVQGKMQGKQQGEKQNEIAG